MDRHSVAASPTRSLATAAVGRIAAWAAIVATANIASGCGTVFYGRTQDITLKTSPPGALASLGGTETTTPGTVTMRRNQPHGWAVVRATRPGFQPACTVIGGRFRVAFLVLDGLFLGLPMLVDLIGMGSINALRKYPDEVNLTLRPLDLGETAQPLPSDEEVINMRRRSWVDLCRPNDFRRVSAVATGCFSSPTEITGTVAEAAKLSWIFHCDGKRFLCASDRRLATVTCTEAGD